MILSAFLNQFFEFVNDIQRLFPDSVDIATAKNSLTMLRTANPSIAIKFWKSYICTNYATKIQEGDIAFFLTKDYRDDFLNNGTSVEGIEPIMEAINRFREPLRDLDASNKQIVLQYLQNLTTLAEMYV